MHSYSTAPPYLDRLTEGIQKAVTQLVANVGVVDPAEPRYLLAQLDKLVRAGIAPGGIVKPRRDSERAFLHPLPQHRFHILDLVGSGRLGIPADGVYAQRGVADYVGHVHCRFPVEGQ